LAVAGSAFVRIRIQYLTRCLVLELVVLAEEVFAEAALEHSAAKVPDASLAFRAHHVRQRTRARVSLQALPPVTNKRLAKVADRTHHAQPSDESGWMFDDAVSAFRHTFDFAALTASRQTLHSLAKVTECAVFLLPPARVAFHDEVAGHFDDGLLGAADLLLPLSLLFRFLTLTCFFLGHFRMIVNASPKAGRGLEVTRLGAGCDPDGTGKESLAHPPADEATRPWGPLLGI